MKDCEKLTYESGKCINPFTHESNRIIFADDTASGRPCPLIDRLVEKNIYPYYSNTHSNALCGSLMKKMVNQTYDIIRENFRVKSDKKIIFNGNGCTGAINHLINKIDVTKYKKIVIHTTPFEHHSNYLPWIELLKKHSCFHNYDDYKINYRIMPYDSDYNIITEDYLNNLQKELSESDITLTTRLDIFALTGCSNVTGKRYDLQYGDLRIFVNDYHKKHNYKMYIFIDYACSAPYIDIDMRLWDGCAFSGHKFLGGQATPGVLIVNEDLLQIDTPYQPGGGCVNEADIYHVEYKHDKELLEMCGTPGIVGIIRLGYVLLTKQSIHDKIEKNESSMSEYIKSYIIKLCAKYPELRVIGLNQKTKDDLPIFSVSIKGMHYNLVTVLFNDLFGIQTRGGLSCAGTFGKIIKEQHNINGWCRITFNYLLKRRDIGKILKGLEYILINKDTLRKYYSYNKNTNTYSFSSL